MSTKIILKRIILIILAFIGYCLCLPLWRRIRGNKNNSIRILRYHSVSDFRRHEVNVKIDNFKRQMKFLKKFYNPVSVNIFVNPDFNWEKLPNQAVCVTFDDGYMDNFLNAYSVLKELDIPAAIFLITDYMGTDRILPHDKNDELKYNLLLSWRQIQEMSDNQIIFGSHTATHINLGKSSTEEAALELRVSKKIIEDRLNKKIIFCSYPYGTSLDFNRNIKEIAAKEGYACGFSARYGKNYKDTDRFELKRIGVENSDTLFTFKAKLNGALDILSLFETRLGRALIKGLNLITGA